MSRIIKPEALFDSLSLAHKLNNFFEGFKLEEIHLFSYFSSILFLYKRNSLTDWEYQFQVDVNGYPYSNDIDGANYLHIQNLLFEEKVGYITLTGNGIEEFYRLKNLKLFQRREEYLDAACTASIVVPYSETVRALLSDPEVANKKELRSKTFIDHSGIYAKLAKFSESIGLPEDDLIVPAVNWIEFLSKVIDNNS